MTKSNQSHYAIDCFYFDNNITGVRYKLNQIANLSSRQSVATRDLLITHITVKFLETEEQKYKKKATKLNNKFTAI